MVDATSELTGIGLPALRQGGGYFASKSKYDVAFSDLLHAVFTPIGTRPYQRAFGSALHLSLFDPATVTLQSTITQVIKTAVNTWAPHLYVASVQLQIRGQEVAIGLTFGLVSERANQDRLILLSKSDVTKLLAAKANHG